MEKHGNSHYRVSKYGVGHIAQNRKTGQRIYIENEAELSAYVNRFETPAT